MRIRTPYIPGSVVQASDRRYVVDKRGNLRVLDYEPAPVPAPEPAAPVVDPVMLVASENTHEHKDLVQTVV